MCCPCRRCCAEAFGFRQRPEPVHPLHGASSRTFDKIVNDAHDDDGIVVAGYADSGIVGCDDVFQARRAVDHANEVAVFVVVSNSTSNFIGRQSRFHPGLQRYVNTTCERPGMRHEMY